MCMCSIAVENYCRQLAPSLLFVAKFLTLLDVAELALHQCVDLRYETNDKGSCEISEITYCYEFLDDFVTPKPTLNAFLADIFRWRPENRHDRIVEEAMKDDIVLENIPTKATATPTVQSIQHGVDETAKNRLEDSEDDSWLQEKFNRKTHPLELMVSFK